MSVPAAFSACSARIWTPSPPAFSVCKRRIPNRRYRVYVYLNLWSTVDPTEVIHLVRAAMRKAGFAFSDEAVSYNDDTRQTLVAWTWVCWEDDG